MILQVKIKNEGSGFSYHYTKNGVTSYEYFRGNEVAVFLKKLKQIIDENEINKRQVEEEMRRVSQNYSQDQGQISLPKMQSD